jgi:hypothetical protein
LLTIVDSGGAQMRLVSQVESFEQLAPRAHVPSTVERA